MIICAGNNETFDFAEPMGVGLIDTAINLTRLCLFDKPEFLLFVGTAGSYGNHNIFDVLLLVPTNFNMFSEKHQKTGGIKRCH